VVGQRALELHHRPRRRLARHARRNALQLVLVVEEADVHGREMPCVRLGVCAVPQDVPTVRFGLCVHICDLAGVRQRLQPDPVELALHAVELFLRLAQHRGVVPQPGRQVLGVRGLGRAEGCRGRRDRALDAVELIIETLDVHLHFGRHAPLVRRDLLAESFRAQFADHAGRDVAERLEKGAESAWNTPAAETGAAK